METVQVSKDFVMQAYNAACPEWKKKIENHFPLLIPQMMKTNIEAMGTYLKFHDRSLGSCLEFRDGCIYVVITRPSMDCLFTAMDFVKDFITKNTNYTVLMTPSQFILKRIP